MLNKRQIKSIKAIDGWDEFAKEAPSSSRKKRELLALAKRGEPRPVIRKHPLGSALCCYTNKRQKLYDPKFDKEVRKLAPSWFIKTADENKKQLIAMAKIGKSRPGKWKHPLGSALSCYANKHHKLYDPKFDKQIRKLAPQWFVKTSDKHKQQLIAMAKGGEPRPVQNKHPLGSALCRYTNKKKPTYDPKFDKKIRRLTPSWFVHTLSENKKQITAMAKRGEPRPGEKKHPLGSALSCYTNKKKPTYDPKFDKEIRKLAPQWFVKTSLENKKQLIAMAKGGEPRPVQNKHPLGSALYCYTNKNRNTYDAKFDKEIRQLTPNWFKKAA